MAERSKKDRALHLAEFLVSSVLTPSLAALGEAALPPVPSRAFATPRDTKKNKKCDHARKSVRQTRRGTKFCRARGEGEEGEEEEEESSLCLPLSSPDPRAFTPHRLPHHHDRPLETQHHTTTEATPTHKFLTRKSGGRQALYGPEG